MAAHHRVWTVVLCVLCTAFVAQAAGLRTIYQVPALRIDVVGPIDDNIFADDVHFGVPSIISEIRIPLAIAGKQECTLWIFDALNSPPIHTVPFKNVPARSQFDFHEYVFEMDVQVPSSIYVGFSAKGDGWTANDTDWWECGNNVTAGLPGDSGLFFFGSVDDGVLTTGFFSPDPSLRGALTVRATPVRIQDFGMETNHLALTIQNLPIYATNTLERAESTDAEVWHEVEMLPLGEASVTWFGPVSNEWSQHFFRVLSH